MSKNVGWGTKVCRSCMSSKKSIYGERCYSCASAYKLRTLEARNLLSLAEKNYYKKNPNAGRAHGARMKRYYEDHPEARLKLADSLKKSRAFQCAMQSPVYREKMRAHMVGKFGERNPGWKGGRSLTGEGYVSVLAKDHPFADCQGRVLEHRLIMERVLSRYLGPIEVVHHINGITSDNRPENLRLFKNSGEHTNFHRRMARLDRIEAKLGIGKEGG